MPIPSFLRMPIYAFEISDKSYKYLRLKEVHGGIVVDDFGEGEIAAGIIERGEIKKKDILISILKELFHKKNIRFVAISLPEEKGFLENIQIAAVKDEEIKSSLELQLEEYIPLPPAEVIFDYNVVGTEKGHIDIALNAFPRALIESYLEVFSSAGALPTFVESELTASTRALVPKNLSTTDMVIDWGKTRISFFIVKNGCLRFTSTIPIGGEALDQAIAKSLNMGIKEAEQLKFKNGFLPASPNLGGPASPSLGGQNQNSVQIFQAIVPLITAIREEIEKYINFWQTHSENKEAPSKLWLAGGDGNLLGLGEYLATELKIPVELANPWVNVKFPKFYLPNIERSDSLRFATSIGLALAAIETEKII